MRWLHGVLGISIVCGLRVSDTRKIFAGTHHESSISKDNLTELLEASFDTSICCNVLLAGDSPAIMNVFNKFVKVCRYAYTLNSVTNICPDYFLISTSVDDTVSAMRIVPMKIASIQLLIVIISVNVEELSDLFNVSMYQDASVNIAAHNGLWTLSKNILNSRDFKKVYRFHKMTCKRTFLDFQGQEVQAVTVFRPPYSYLRSTVNRTINGIAAEFYSVDDQSELDGIEVQLFLLMANRLNFTWTIRQWDHFDRYGKRNGSGWNGGMIGQIYHKKVDIAFSAMFLALDKYEVTNSTQPWGPCLSTFAVPKPKPHRIFFALITPLSKEVWGAVLIMLIIQSIYICGRAWIDPQIPGRFRNFPVTLTELMGQLLGVWMPARMQGLRLYLYLWHLAGVLLVTAYSSNLAAHLARELYENKINTIQELAESNLTWGSRFKLVFGTIFDVSNPYANEVWKRFELQTSEAETREKILKGNYAIYGTVIDSIFFPRDQINDEDLQVMAMLRESGLVQYHIGNVVQRHVAVTQRELLIKKDDDIQGPKVLKLTSLGIGFCILILGLSLSTVVFFLELKYFNKDLSPLEVLIQIEKNREIWRIKELRRKRRYPFFGKF